MIPACILCLWCASFILSIPVGFQDMSWVRVNGTGKVAFHFHSHHISGPYMLWVGVLLATVTSTTVSLYVYMFYKVRTMSVEQRRALKTQVKLALCAFFVAMFLAILSVCFCLFSFYTETIMWGDNALAFFVSCDLNTFCNVYVLLSTSTVVRNRVRMFARRLFCCKTDETSSYSTKKTRARITKRFNTVIPKASERILENTRRQDDMTGIPQVLHVETL